MLISACVRRLRYIALAATCFTLVVFGHETSASAQVLPEGLYEDAKEIVTDLIREDVARGVAEYLRGEAPALAAYFADSIKRFEAAQWGALRDAAKRETRVFTTDFVYWALSHCEPTKRATDCLRRFVTCGREGTDDQCSVQDGWLALEDEVTGKIDSPVQADGQKKRTQRSFRLEKALVDLSCTRASGARSVLACDAARAVDAALAGKRVDVEGHIGALIADLLASADVIGRDLAQPLGEALASPAGFVSAHQKLFSALRIDAASLANVRCEGGQGAARRTLLCRLLTWSDVAPALVLTWNGAEERLPFRSVRSLDLLGALTEANHELVAKALRIVTHGNTPVDKASGTLGIAIGEAQANVIVTNGAYDPRALESITNDLHDVANLEAAASEIERLYPDRDVAKVAAAIVTVVKIIARLEERGIVARTEGQLRVDPARLVEVVDVIDGTVDDAHKLCPALKWVCAADKGLRGVQFLARVLGVALRGNIRDVVTELAPTALLRGQFDAANKKDFDAIEMELFYKLDLSVKKDGAAISGARDERRKDALVAAVAAKSSVSTEKATAKVEAAIADISEDSQATDVRARFLVAFALYLLDDDAPTSAGTVSKQAFRAAAKDLILSEGRSGYPAADPHWLDFKVDTLPNLSLRASFSSAYSQPGEDTSSARYIVSVEPFVIRWRPSRNVGAQLSFLDVLGPLSEAVTRKRPYAREREWLILSDLVRPRLGVWLGIPELSRHVLVTAGVGFRFLDTTRRSSTQPDKFEYGLVWEGDARLIDAFEGQAAVSWVF